MIRTTLKSRPLIGGAIALAVVAGGLVTARSPGASQGAAPVARAVPVAVRTLAPKPIRTWSEFSGRLHAVEQVEIRPEVSGRITAVRFEDGQAVKAGDVLFVIDPRPYEAAVAKAEANLAQARTNADFARLELTRAVGLRNTEAIAERIYDERANASRGAVAAQQAAEAARKQASLDLEHAVVRSPIDGRASRAEITLGNLVQAGPGAPLLTTVVASRPIYADFDVDEQTYLQSIRDSASDRDQERRIPVEIALQGDRDHVFRGHIDSFDNRLDPGSGTIRARARFDNADGTLVPGMFVSVRLGGAETAERILVPERAIAFDQSRKFVYVVDENNHVAYREVELGKKVAADRIALAGVAAGDRVVVDGIQHLRAEATVEPREAAADQPAASGLN
ncbi:MAG: efflux RND transporter periplasmic adaptor subunit [Telmatospirillum sp.]|nr:efflux RND transporter periplasmic adaptor subunit [Telmatospirillum sp.]